MDNACSAQSNNIYPYGDNYWPDTCNGADAVSGTTVTVVLSNGTPETTIHPSCISGAPTLRHMSGNVAEWEDSCNGNNGMADNCRLRGGNYGSFQAQLRCDADVQLPRDYSSAQVGFRCCL